MNRGGQDGAKETALQKKRLIYDHSTIKVIIFACCTIVLAVLLTGGISYFITRNAVVDKLKTRDIIYIVESIASKVDGRIERAREMALVLAKDPTITAWVAGGEQDERLGQYSKTKIDDIARNYDYANSFIVSTITRHYWAEGFKLAQTMSETDPNDHWFFQVIRSGKPVELNIDYNKTRHDTFVFLNALIGDTAQPVGVSGVGLSLKDIAGEFQNYKFGEKSNLWLVDGKGRIHLADNTEQNGSYLNDFIPADICAKIVEDTGDIAGRPKVIEYVNAQGETVDLAYQKTKSTDWKLVFQITRSESISILDTIKLNTAIAGLVALLMMVLVFYFVSRRIANPLRQAIAVTKMMEEQVEERTRELAETNQKIMDSIDYAKMLQESILPSEQELQAILGDYFILWRPRDIVGGDFYWVYQADDGRKLIAVGDCTGHGVPGAFMTMAVHSVLKNLVDQNYFDPAEILAELNRRMKEILHRNNSGHMSDDGLDMAICCIENTGRLTFAGAKIPLYVFRNQQVYTVKGNIRSIGYRRSRQDLVFANHTWDIQPGDRFYLTTDGFIDQNGGEKDLPLGRRRFLESIVHAGGQPIHSQDGVFIELLSEYMGDEPQRDDITLIGFSIN